MSENPPLNFKRQILMILSDGRFHSGQAIAQQLAVSRSAVWKHIKQLKTMGADIYSIQGKGYQIAGGLDLLNPSYLQQSLTDLLPSPEQVTVFTSIASTNKYLMALPQTETFPRLCLAEYQSAGRGRLGRDWHSPFAHNIYLSLRCMVPLAIDALSGLSLVVGCSVATVLQRQGVADIQLKWPNDLRLKGLKVGGILVEIAGQTEEGSDLVIGLGLNWDMPQDAEIDQPWTNLKPYVQQKISRNQMIVELVKALIADLEQFSRAGFGAFLPVWQPLDEFVDQLIVLTINNRKIRGRYCGVDQSGALLLETNGQVQRFMGGEVSLRKGEKDNER